MESNNKKAELTTKKKRKKRKKDDRPKSIKKDLKPKTREGIGLRAHETKGRKKKAQPPKIKRSIGNLVIRTGPGYLGTARSSGSSGCAVKVG